VPSLVEVADASGGRAQRGDLRGLIRSVDQVRAHLDNQYRVRFRSTDAETAEVRVTTAGGVLTGSVDLSAPPPTVPPREEEPAGRPATETQAAAAEDEDGGGSGAVIAVVALLVLLAAAGIGALLLVRRRRATGPPPGPVVLDLRDAPTRASGSATAVGDQRTEPGP
jgi:hypothetical protein